MSPPWKSSEVWASWRNLSQHSFLAWDKERNMSLEVTSLDLPFSFFSRFSAPKGEQTKKNCILHSKSCGRGSWQRFLTLAKRTQHTQTSISAYHPLVPKCFGYFAHNQDVLWSCFHQLANSSRIIGLFSLSINLRSVSWINWIPVV